MLRCPLLSTSLLSHLNIIVIREEFPKALDTSLKPELQKKKKKSRRFVFDPLLGEVES
jgi:hypothetical protein